MNKLKITIQGHRGARGYYPENTITGFIEAVKMGVDAIELDVVISKDQKVIVSHEPWMNSDFCLKPDGTEIEEGLKSWDDLKIKSKLSPFDKRELEGFKKSFIFKSDNRDLYPYK